MLRALIPWLLAAAALPAAAQPGTLKFRGYAYDLKTNKYLYTELQEQKVDGDRWLGGTVEYLGPDGKQIAFKTLDFSRDPYVPVYRLDIRTRGGYMEAITAVTPERIEMERRAYGSTQVEKAWIPHPPLVAADSGFHVFLRDHFRELIDGKTIPFVFAVASGLDGFKFRATRMADTRFEGRPAVRFRVELNSLLRWVAPIDPLEVTYDPVQRKLLEYRGVSNLHDPATGNAYNARIVYPSSPPADAPPLPAGK